MSGNPENNRRNRPVKDRRSILEPVDQRHSPVPRQGRKHQDLDRDRLRVREPRPYNLKLQVQHRLLPRHDLSPGNLRRNHQALDPPPFLGAQRPLHQDRHLGDQPRYQDSHSRSQHPTNPDPEAIRCRRCTWVL